MWMPLVAGFIAGIASTVIGIWVVSLIIDQSID